MGGRTEESGKKMRFDQPRRAATPVVQTRQDQTAAGTFFFVSQKGGEIFAGGTLVDGFAFESLRKNKAMT